MLFKQLWTEHHSERNESTVPVAQTWSITTFQLRQVASTTLWRSGPGNRKPKKRGGRGPNGIDDVTLSLSIHRLNVTPPTRLLHCSLRGQGPCGVASTGKYVFEFCVEVFGGSSLQYVRSKCQKKVKVMIITIVTKIGICCLLNSARQQLCVRAPRS